MQPGHLVGAVIKCLGSYELMCQKDMQYKCLQREISYAKRSVYFSCIHFLFASIFCFCPIQFLFSPVSLSERLSLVTAGSTERFQWSHPGLIEEAKRGAQIHFGSKMKGGGGGVKK